MRKDYPISSQEFNDIVQTAYGDLVYLLGYSDSDGHRYSGIFETIEESGIAYLASTSGIPHLGNADSKNHLGLDPTTTSNAVIQYLKFDYIYRKSKGFIRGN